MLVIEKEGLRIEKARLEKEKEGLRIEKAMLVIEKMT